jgi:hypothetical protein
VTDEFMMRANNTWIKEDEKYEAIDPYSKIKRKNVKLPEEVDKTEKAWFR